MFAWIARVVVRRPWWTIAVWLVLSIGVIAFAPALSTSSDQGEFLPDSYESVRASNLGEEAFPRSDGASGVLVVSRADGAALTGADQERVAALADELAGAGLDRVDGVTTGPEQVSRGQRVQLVNVTFAGSAEDESTLDAAGRLREEVAAELAGTGLRAGLTGEVGYAVDSEDAFSGAERIIGVTTVVLIVVLMLLVFRSPVAALLPIVTVALVQTVSTGLIGVAGEAFGLRADQSITAILTVVLFGIGTDYILFLLFRYRERLRAGDEPKQAIITAVARIGEVIAAAAAVVIIAFGALALSSLGMLKSMGPALVIAVALTLLAALTLVPAIVSLLGTRVFWPSKNWRREPRGGLIRRVAALPGGRPALTAAVSTVLLGGLAVAAFGFSANYDLNSSLPDDLEAVEAYETLQEGFPPGALNPTNVYLRSETGGPLDQTAVRAFATNLTTVDGVASAMPPRFSPDATVARVDVVLAEPPSSTEALDALESSVRPAAHEAAPPGSEVLVGGATATFVDTREATTRDYTLVFPLAGLLIAVVLGLLLRSLIAPWYLMIAVGLTVAATLAVSVLVFQDLLGEPGLIFQIPIIMYLFVVAIGSDYNILMVSRLREEAAAGGSPRRASRFAVVQAGPSIAAAALILAGTFAAMLLSGIGMMSQMGMAVSIGVILSAFVMSMFLVPALTALFGRAAWWPGLRLGRARRQEVAVATEPSLVLAGAGWHDLAVHGQVRRSDRSPAARTVLTLIDTGGRQIARGHSGAGGEYRLPVPTAGRYVVIASGDAAQPDASTVVVDDEPVEHDVTLRGAGALTGQVRHGDTGAGLAATVTLTDERGEVIAAGTTRGDGRYRLAGLAAGPGTLAATAEHCRPVAIPVTVPEAGALHQDIELAPAADVAGRVSVGPAGRPAVDVQVALVDTAGDTVARTRSDTGGRYQFLAVPTGDYTLVVAGYPPVGTRLRVDGPRVDLDIEVGYPERP